jgi:hypothetical protein
MYKDVLINYIIHINGIGISAVLAKIKGVVVVQLGRLPNGSGKKYSRKPVQICIDNAVVLHIM